MLDAPVHPQLIYSVVCRIYYIYQLNITNHPRITLLTIIRDVQRSNDPQPEHLQLTSPNRIANDNLRAPFTSIRASFSNPLREATTCSSR